jgi:N,N'-diacetylbacillosaminyl-diphospho-undecaprenol alpha-1,3-N-acetylgalactosaminyltransferase
LFGRISHMDLIGEIKNSDVAVLPSLYEAQPMFALEAMACKKPMVIFDFPYARELITDMKTGVLCKTCNSIDLAEKISLLLSDENLRRKLGQMANEYVSENHDWDIQAEKYIEVYKETLEKTSQNE